MNLKELIKEVERLQKEMKDIGSFPTFEKLEGIKQTVEAVHHKFKPRCIVDREYQDWQTLRELLGLRPY